MHVQRSRTHEEARPTKLFLFVMFAQNVADVLAEKTLDALAKFLYTIHIALIHLPLDAGPRLEWRDLLIHSEVPGDVRHQILDDRECFHGEDRDGLIEGKRVHARLAGEPWTAIHLG